MQTVILAGGLGTRLRPSTHQIPKSMAPINGRPYLEYQVEYLRKLGLKNILFLVGYLGGKIISHFRNGKDFGVDIEYSKEEVPLGTAGALRQAYGKLDGTFLLLYGDSFLPINYKELIHQFEKTGKKGMVAAYDNSAGDSGVRNNLNVGENGVVLRYEKNGNGDDLRYVEAGVLVLKRAAVDLVPCGRASSLEKEVFPELIRQKELWAYVTAQRFYDIGTPDRLLIASQYFQKL